MCCTAPPHLHAPQGAARLQAVRCCQLSLAPADEVQRVQHASLVLLEPPAALLAGCDGEKTLSLQLFRRAGGRK
jgi:hypothetical protein